MYHIAFQHPVHFGETVPDDVATLWVATPYSSTCRATNDLILPETQQLNIEGTELLLATIYSFDTIPTVKAYDDKQSCWCEIEIIPRGTRLKTTNEYILQSSEGLYLVI